MNHFPRLMITYGRDSSQNGLSQAEERRANFERAHAQMLDGFRQAEEIWNQCGQDIDDKRLISTAVLTASVTFLKRLGIPQFAFRNLHELVLALSEANAGRKPDLLDRAAVHPGSLSPTDLIYQGAAQTCVDLLTGAGIPVGEARKRVARQFSLKKVKGFSVPTLNKLGSRLTGRGARDDRAYDYYRMTSVFANAEIAQRGAQRPISEAMASVIVKAVVEKAISEDLVQKRYSA